MIKITEIAWLGGLLEAEGFFGLNDGKYPMISLLMTDEDVVTKVAAMWDTRVCHQKNLWTTTVWGIKAISFMMTLYPFFGNCRKSTVIRIISFWKSRNYKRELKYNYD